MKNQLLLDNIIFVPMHAVTQHNKITTLFFSSVDLSIPSLAEIKRIEKLHIRKNNKNNILSCNQRNTGRPKGFILLRPIGKRVLYL